MFKLHSENSLVKNFLVNLEIQYLFGLTKYSWLNLLVILTSSLL
jgi:hypothetical protein